MSFCQARKRRFHWVAAAVLCTAGPVLAEKVSTDLPITPSPNANTLNMTVTATIAFGTRSDSDTATVTGNVLSDAAILFDPLTNAVSNIHSLELTGGQFAMSNVSMNLTWKVFFVTVASINLNSTNIRGTFDTPNPPGLVIGGSFEAAEHQVIMNNGTLVATGTVSQSVDLAAQPMIGNGAGAGTITLGSPTLSGDTLSYPMSIMLPASFDQVVYDQPGTITASAKVNGNMLAAGTLTRKLPVNVPTWNIDGGGTWANAASWKTGTFPNAPGATAWLLNKLTAGNSPATVTLEGETTVGTIVFENASRYSIVAGSGGMLKLDNAGGGSVVHVIRGSHLIAAPIQVVDGGVIDVAAGAELQATAGLALAAGKSLAKRGAGVAMIAGGVVLDPSSSINVIEGDLKLESIENGTLRIGQFATASLDPNATATKASLVHSLEIAGATDAWLTTLDLNRGRLIVQADTQAPADVLAQLTNQIVSARNTATPWTGNGITSSAARADARGMTGIGVIANDIGDGAGTVNTVFGDLAVNANSILMKYTWNGDANLDGIVNADDYFLVDSGFITQKGGWYNGDFNYDGVVNADDYFLIDSAFIGQTGWMAIGHVAAVPEPGVIGLLAIAGVGLLGRRRCHRPVDR